MSHSRRRFLKVLGTAATLALPSTGAVRALAAEPATADDFFVFIHAAGGWDVTLWADPRNEKRGLVQPASTENTDTSQLKRWVDTPLADSAVKTFQPIKAPGRPDIVFGPGIGDLVEIFDRAAIFNGVSMNTVSHPDGSGYSATGRHLVGGRVLAPSIDVMLANELGREQLLPAVSVQFPSAYFGDNLDPRVMPLTVGNIASVSRTVARSQAYDDDVDRDLVSAMLTAEARDLAKRAQYPSALEGFASQFESVRKMLSERLQEIFTSDGLARAHPNLPYKNRFVGGAAVNVAFAIEAAKRNLARCISFSIGGFDTHGSNYRTQAQLQQETFGLVTSLVRELDATPHPTQPGRKLSDHTHVMVMSEFCRTPQINLGQGRDHYPNNSALVISPRFRGGRIHGKSDPEQLLPLATRTFKDGARPITPPDLLATFLHAFQIAPRKYLRDGEVLPDLLSA